MNCQSYNSANNIEENGLTGKLQKRVSPIFDKWGLLQFALIFFFFSVGFRIADLSFKQRLHISIMPSMDSSVPFFNPYVQVTPLGVLFSFWAIVCVSTFRFLLVLLIGKTIHWERKGLQGTEFITCLKVLVQEYMSLGLLYLRPGQGVRLASLIRTGQQWFTLVRLTMLGRDFSSMDGQVLIWEIATQIVVQMILRMCLYKNGLDCLMRYCQEATPLFLDGLL